MPLPAGRVERRLVAIIAGPQQQAIFPISTRFIRTLPQELSPLHTFCTSAQQFAVAFTSTLRHSDRQPKRAKFPSAAGQKFSVAGDSLEGESSGEFRFMSSEPEPGHAASSEILLQGRMEALNFEPEARVSVGSLPGALRSLGAIIFRPWRKTAVGSIRDNNAAWVAGPSRICFVRLSPDQPEKRSMATRS
jgi:hypothetical protein